MTLAPEGRIELQLTGGGCACCAIDATDAGVPAGAHGQPAGAAASSPIVEATFGVAGMTCGNCVRHVTDELASIDGVDAVEVELVAGGVSNVTVRSETPISESAINAAVAEAGYRVAER